VYGTSKFHWKRSRANMKTFVLSYPVTLPDGEEIKELQLRRLKAKEMKPVDLGRPTARSVAF